MRSSRKHKRSREKRRRHHSHSDSGSEASSPEPEKRRKHHDHVDSSEQASDSKRKRSNRHSENHPTAESVSQDPEDDEEIHPAGGSRDSLSIEETNKLRIKLGLKPLDVGGSEQPKLTDGDTGDAEAKPKKKEDVHVPAINIGEKKRAERLREKIDIKKDKRSIAKKLSKVKTLGETDSDDDSAAAWVNKSRLLEEQRKQAEARAKLLDQMDEEFGIGDMVEKEFADVKVKEENYDAKHLAGLRIEHSAEKFSEGKDIILTLADQDVLADNPEDILVNVNIVDDEKAEENVVNKRLRPDYKPWEEAEFDDKGELQMPSILGKYDEEIEGKTKSSFKLEREGTYDMSEERQQARIRENLKKAGESLETFLVERRDRFTDEDATFKKPRKKKVRKVRKRVTADELLALDPEADKQTDRGSRSRSDVEAVRTKLHTDSRESRTGLKSAKELITYQGDDLVQPSEDLTGIKVEEEDYIDELEASLSKARRLQQKKIEGEIPSQESLAAELLANRPAVSHEEEELSNLDDLAKLRNRGVMGNSIVLNQMSEFCRSLGDIPTYGLAGNRPDEERDEILDFERELMERAKKRKEEEETPQAGWTAVDIDEQKVTIETKAEEVLNDEPTVDGGVGSALKLAMQKGYIEKEKAARPSGIEKIEHLMAKKFLVEDKRYDDIDSKYKGRDRFSGPLSEFKEKRDYSPHIAIDYVDESGRKMGPKEAFQFLSYKFHGRGPGKKKREKSMLKRLEEQSLTHMDSTDTPLQTLEKLKSKTKVEQAPYVVLSNKATGNPIAK